MNGSNSRWRIEMENKRIYTADEEEPDCGRCDNCDLDSEYFCVNSCGPEHGWYGYEGTKYIDDEEN